MKDLKLKARAVPRGEIWTRRCEGSCGGFVADDQRFCRHCLISRYGLLLHERHDSLDHLGMDHLYEGEAVDELLRRVDAILGDGGYAALLALADEPPEDVYEFEKGAFVKIRARTEDEAEKIASQINGSYIGPGSSLSLDDGPVYRTDDLDDN